MMRISKTGRKIGTAPIFQASFGFTMVELLTVIAIIAILAAMLMPALNRARRQAWETTSRTMISSLEAALAQYMTDYGDYPQDDDDANVGSNSVNTCVNLIARLEDSDGKSYASFRSQDKDSGSLKDPWGQAYCYHYKSPSRTLQGSTYGIKFNIWSKGVDKTTDSVGETNPDDITNWKTTKGQ